MRSRHIILSSVLGLLLGACGGDDEPPGSGSDEGAMQSASVEAKVGPIERTVESEERADYSPDVDANLVAEGERLYKKNCVMCHQEDAIGKPGVAPSLTNKEFLSIASDKFLKSTIRDGREGTGMPPFAHLGKSGIDAIVAYLRSHAQLPNNAAAVDSQPQAQGDPRLGKLWFEQICATCHGPKGNGYLAGGTGTAIGRAGFLDKASDGFIRTTIQQGRSNTRMRGFQGPDALANLSAKEIDDIIAYLRSIKH